MCDGKTSSTARDGARTGARRTVYTVYPYGIVKGCEISHMTSFDWLVDKSGTLVYV